MREKGSLSKKKILKSRKAMAIIGCAAIGVAFASGFAVYSANKPQQESKSLSQEVESINTSSKKVEIQLKLPKAQPVVIETKKKDNNDATEQQSANDESAKKQAEAQTKAKRNEGSTIKKENTQVKQSPAKSSTYTSKNLGVTFDIPASWANKYVIKDSGTDISVSMKRDPKNLQTGDGLLFIITTDFDGFNNGSFLDSVPGVNKVTTIKGKKYLVGPPTDCRVEVGDPDQELYRIMSHQISQVLKTLR
jgi:DUF4097 and DUF4098 domain-containing protein YvlB